MGKFDWEQKFCSECGKRLTVKNMWSEHTCKECAEELDLNCLRINTIYEDEKYV